MSVELNMTETSLKIGNRMIFVNRTEYEREIGEGIGKRMMLVNRIRQKSLKKREENNVCA